MFPKTRSTVESVTSGDPDKIRDQVPCPRVWVIVAGMPCGPLEIPESLRTSEEAVIDYVLEMMKGRIKGRAVVEMSEKRTLIFARNDSGDPYLHSDRKRP